jgi:hypothetical protein
MMNWLLIFIVLTAISSNTLHGQQDRSAIRCEGQNYQGFIFDSTYGGHGMHGFTPSCDDVNKAEKILRLNIKTVNRQGLNQAINRCPVIHKKLQKYIRQYVGFINDNGQKVIWINCFWRKMPEALRASKELIMVNDGCSYFWNIEVNIDTQTLNNLRVNGSA